MTNDPERLGNLLGPLTSRLGAGSARSLGKVWKHWAEIVGPEIARHAEPTSLKDGVLRIKVDSPSWATELTYLVQDLRVRINRAVEEELVTDIKVWTGPGGVGSSGAGSGPSSEAKGAVPKEAAKSPIEALDRARKAWVDRRSEGRREGR